MVKQYKKWIVATIGAILLSWSFMFAMTSSAKTTSQKVHEAQKELEESQKKLEQSKEQIDEMEDSKAQLEGKLADLQQEVSTVGSKLEQSSARLHEKQANMEEVAAQLVSAEAVEVQQYESMKKRIQFMYESNSSKNGLHMLLESRNIADMLNQVEFVQELMEYDRTMLNQYSQMKEAIASAKATLEKEEKELQTIVDDVKKQQQKLDSLVTDTTKDIATQTEDMEEAQAKALAYEKQLEEQQNTLEALKEREAEEKRILEMQAQLNSGGTTAGQPLDATESDMKLLATIIYCEAGNQPYEGQIAVGSVVVNRIRSPLFPDTMVGVLYQKSQFTPVMSGRFAIALANDSATQSCYDAAREVLAGKNNVPNCLFFRTIIPGKEGTIIGDHIFY